MQFPENFLWGTAISAHQTEGYNTNSDWWYWEKGKFPKSKKRRFSGEPSGMACDFYNRYNEDFKLAKGMNNNAIRVSVEWARIEPEQGRWDNEEIEHYRKMLNSARENGLQTFITLQHFTKPIWLAERGGWHNPLNIKHFRRYAKKCAEEFGDLVDAFITINEPQVYVMQAYWRSKWTPMIKSRIYSLIAQIDLMIAHRKAYKAIKEVNSEYKVGIAKNIVWYEARPCDERGRTRLIDRLTAKFLYFLNSYFFLKPILSTLDFIGLNYYFTAWIKGFKEENANDIVSDLGWWVHPEGIKPILLDLKKYNKPICITEHGIADAWDNKRQWYLNISLKFIFEAMQEGADVRGYFHWALIDNFEWHIGFWPKFGLIEIDRKRNLERRPRPSYYLYARICSSGSLDTGD